VMDGGYIATVRREVDPNPLRTSRVWKHSVNIVNWRPGQWMLSGYGAPFTRVPVCQG
jgi:hypothetical protein